MRVYDSYTINLIPNQTKKPVLRVNNRILILFFGGGGGVGYENFLKDLDLRFQELTVLVNTN